MARVLLLCGFLTLQILRCLSQDLKILQDGFGDYPSQYSDYQSLPKEEDPSVGEYFMEAVDWMNRTRWRYFLPEDTDIDQDGNLSDLEVQHKFNTYMGEVFKLIDHDGDNSISEEELRSLKLDIPHLTKVVDIALENFPLRPFFLAADGNGDGVYDENDFYLPKEISRRGGDINIIGVATNVTVNNNSLVILHRYAPERERHGIGYSVNVISIGQNEGSVICKSLGFAGLERVVKAPEIKVPDLGPIKPVAYSCDGTEESLEKCKEVVVKYKKIYSAHKTPMGNGVVCRGPNKYETLHLVGGKDSSSGDIFVGREALTCNDWITPYKFSIYNFQVVCRELGYSGVQAVTFDSAFTGEMSSNHIEKKIKCKGNEEKLADCAITHDRCWERYGFGVVCATDGRTVMNRGLSDLLEWDTRYRIWEEYGRFLFIADANGDGKLTLEELATKGKELLTKILEFLDENQDGKISLEDINLHLSVGPIQNLVSELFDDVTAGQDEFDLYNIKIAGQDMSKFFGNGIRNFWGLRNLDNNEDEKVNAADIFSPSRQRANIFKRSREEPEVFLIPLLSEKLDKNQDGKIQREELRQFIDDMFKQLDMDKNGALTLEDAYILLRDNGLNCLQVGAFRSFTKVFLDKIDTVTRNFFVYIFHQFDIDGNGQISPTELEQMHVPCDTQERYGGYRNYDDYNDDNFDPNERKTCGTMFETYFGRKISELIRNFPEFVFSERRGRGRGGHGRGGRDEPQKETLVDKLTQHACEMLS